MYVEAECYESRRMGTETHRETKRVTGMGCCASPAAEPIPNRPFRRLGAKVLTAAWVCFLLPGLVSSSPRSAPLFTTVSASHHPVIFFVIFFLPLNLGYNKLSTIL